MVPDLRRNARTARLRCTWPHSPVLFVFLWIALGRLPKAHLPRKGVRLPHLPDRRNINYCPQFLLGRPDSGSSSLYRSHDNHSALVDAALNNSAGNADTAFGTVVYAVRSCHSASCSCFIFSAAVQSARSMPFYFLVSCYLSPSIRRKITKTAKAKVDEVQGKGSKYVSCML